jgi:hypothetical protein
MGERCILLSIPQVKAIIAGTKSVLRAPCRSPIVETLDGRPAVPRFSKSRTVLASMLPTKEEQERDLMSRSPFGRPGDLLWVREMWGVVHEHGEGLSDRELLEDAHSGMLGNYPWASIVYAADANGAHASTHIKRWRPSIHMPRWASRLLLEVTDVRVERLQSITEEDAQLEGAPDLGVSNLRVALDMGFDRYHFATFWDSTFGEQKGLQWASSPWVWRVAFRMFKKISRPS